MAQIKLLKIASNVPTEHDGASDDITALTVSSDTISERTGAAGVTVDSVVLKDGGVNLAASSNYQINGTDIVADSAGTATLSNIDALDATTEATVEAAIDTLANLTAAAALVTVSALNAGSITSGFGAIDNGASNITSTGVIDFGGATSFELPNGAAPTVDAAGEIAVDTTITDYTGMVKYFDGAEELVVLAVPTANLSTTDNDVVFYDAAANELAFKSGAFAGSDTATYTNANAGSIAKGDVVYMTTTNDEVDLADADTIAQGSVIVGLADATIGAAASGEIFVARGKVQTGILTAATAGDVYFLSAVGTTSNTLTTSAPSGGPAVVKIGFAKNATDLVFDPEFIVDTTA